MSRAVSRIALLVLLSIVNLNGVGIKCTLEIAEAEAVKAPPAAKAKAQATETVGTRGGIRTRANAALAQSGSSSSASSARLAEIGPFTKDLIEDWAKGVLSAKKVQQYAFDAARQGATGLESMAAMGNYGSNPQNCQRSLQNFLGLPAGAPEIQFKEIPTKSSPKTPHPFLLPHCFFQSFYRDCPANFKTRVSSSPGAGFNFWNSLLYLILSYLMCIGIFVFVFYLLVLRMFLLLLLVLLLLFLVVIVLVIYLI